MAEVKIDLNGSAADFIREMQKVVDALQDVERAADDVGDEVDEATDASGAAAGGLDSLKRGAIALGAAIGAARVKDFISDSINLATAAEEAGNKFDATFGPAAAALGREMDELSNKAGVTDFRFRDIVASAGNVIQGLGGTEQQAAQLAGALAPLAVDVASFNGSVGDSDEALQSMTSALTGNRESLKDRWGIVVREAEVIQRALKNSFKDSKDELTELEKAQATYEIITERAGRAVGDLDRNLDSAATQQARMRAEWEESQVVLGEALLPAMMELAPAVTTLAEALGAIAPLLGDIVGQFADGFGPVVEFVGNVAGLASGIEEATNRMPGWIQAIADAAGVVLKILAPVQALGDGFDWVNSRFESGTAIYNTVNAKLEETAEVVPRVGRETRELGDRMQQTKGQTRAWEERVNDLFDAIDSGTTSLGEHRRATLRLADPVFNLIAAQEDYAEAQKEVNRLQALGKTTTPEYKDAVLALVRSYAELSIAEGEVADNPAAISHFEFLSGQVGVSSAMVQDLIGDLEAYNALDVAAKSFVFDIVGGGGSVLVTPGGNVALHHGGIVRARPGGTRATVAEGGDDEAVIPLNQQGAEFLQNALGGAGGGGGGGAGVTIIVQGFVGSELDLAAELDRLLTRRARTSGLEFA